METDVMKWAIVDDNQSPLNKNMEENHIWSMDGR